MLKIVIPLSAIFLISNPKRIWSSAFSVMMLLSVMVMFVMPTFHHVSLSTFMSLDLLSPSLIILTLWISSLMVLASQKIMITNSHPTKFIAMTLMLCLVLVLAFSLNNLIAFYIMFEASLIPTFLLILGWGYQPERVQASSYLLMYTVTASLPLLLSILMINTWNKSLFLFFQMSHPLSATTASIWWLMTISAFLVKVPLYSVHLWLPKAHVEAPVAGSMILAAILLKLGGYGLIRSSALFTSTSPEVKHIVISLALIGGVYSSLICMRQTDLKALIAYSSVGHMGPLIAGAMTNTTWGWQGALIIMIAHGFTSSALFATANMTYETTQSRSVFLTKGLLTMFPAMALFWFILCVANMAGPPSINLLGEITLIAPILSVNIWTAVPLGMLTFLAGAYSLHLYSTINHGHSAAFSNPLSLYSTRNLHVILMHALPSFVLFLKLDSMLPIM